MHNFLIIFLKVIATNLLFFQNGNLIVNFLVKYFANNKFKGLQKRICSEPPNL